jgi:deoxycytidylate deaminase
MDKAQVEVHAMVNRVLVDRPSKHQYLMNIAEAVKTRSHDAQTQFGMILVNPVTSHIVATGYNGYVYGAPDVNLPNMRPDKYPYMVHCEENIITYAARKGIAIEGTRFYCRGTPCAHCTRLLYQAGVYEGVLKEIHATFEDVKQMLDLEVVLTPIEEEPGYMWWSVKPRAYL